MLNPFHAVGPNLALPLPSRRASPGPRARAEVATGSMSVSAECAIAQHNDRDHSSPTRNKPRLAYGTDEEETRREKLGDISLE